MREADYSFSPLTRRDAELIASWRYPAPYHIYDLDKSAISSLTHPDCHYYAIRCGDEMIGFRCYGEDARVVGGDYSVPALDMGGGLRPDLTGRGLGSSVLTAAIQFAKQRFQSDRFRVTVASFNERALRTCLKVGFSRACEFDRPTDRRRFSVLMKEATE